MNSGAFVVQLPSEAQVIEYDRLREFKGINDYYIKPTASTKQVLEKMQELHIDSIPVVDENKQWLFFANREEILARLMTTILLAKEE
jgi:CBS domain-containing protein